MIWLRILLVTLGATILVCGLIMLTDILTYRDMLKRLREARKRLEEERAR